VDATATPAAAVEPVEEVPESALEEPTPDAVRPSSTPRSLQVVARIDEAAQEAANAVAVAAPAQADPGAAAPTGATRPQLGAYAMLGELTGFVERLQEASQLIHQLEGENVQLRQQVARLKEVARPELVADLGTEQQKAKDLQLRLEGAERARDAAVEARTKFEQQAGALREEIEAGKAREAALEAQLEARRRIAQDAAKSLRAIGQMLEG
jgi:vacuolar-type H+-ATPase subunit I/STV1